MAMTHRTRDRTAALAAAALLALLAACVLPSAVVAPPPPKPPTGVSKNVTREIVDLDAPAPQRWAHIVQPRKHFFAPLLAFLAKEIPASVRPLIDELMADLDDYLPAPYPDELRGISTAANVSLGDVVLMNLFYELNSACTSIVACNANGSVWHARNLDYTVPGLQALTVDVDFDKGGKTLYRGTTFVGYVGVLTGLRPGAFSISVDERWTKNGTIWSNALEAIFKHGQSIGFFMRDTLATAETYDAALAAAQTTHLISVEYLILAGTHGSEGAVVTRERDSAINTRPLAPADGQWYVVETNYDWWKAPEHGDDRRTPAQKNMNLSSYTTIDGDHMWWVLSQFPNLNSETAYTTLMSAHDGSLRSVTRNNADAPAPWMHP